MIIMEGEVKPGRGVLLTKEERDIAVSAKCAVVVTLPKAHPGK